MTLLEMYVGLLLGPIVNEVTDAPPWLARPSPPLGTEAGIASPCPQWNDGRTNVIVREGGAAEDNASRVDFGLGLLGSVIAVVVVDLAVSDVDMIGVAGGEKADTWAEVPWRAWLGMKCPSRTAMS
jgi:hypothetical protein